MKRFLFILLILCSIAGLAQVDSSNYKMNIEQLKRYTELSQDEHFNLEERKLFAHKAYQLSRDLNLPIPGVKAQISYGYILAQSGYYAKAFEVFLDANAISDSLGYHSTEDWRRKAYLLNVEGILYKELGIYNKSLKAYYQSLSISDSVDWKVGQSTALNNISNLYFIQGNLDQAIQLQHKALQIAQLANDLGKKYDAYFNLMVMYADLTPLDSAFLYAEKCKVILPKLQSQYQNCFLYEEYAGLFYKSGDREQAQYYYAKGLEIAVDHQFEELQLKCNEGLGNIAKDRLSFDLAISYLTKALVLSDSISVPKLKVEVLFELADLYEQENKLNEAYFYLKEAHSIQDSINETWKSIQQSEVHQIYLLEWQEQENRLLENNLALAQLKLNQRNLMLIGSVISLIVLLWLLTILYRKRGFEKKMSQQVNEQNQTIQEQQDLIHQQNEKQLKLELNAKSRQLATYSLSSIKHVQATEEIISRLSQLIYNQALKAGTKKELEQVIQQMKRDLMKSDWEEFKTYYQQVHPSFYENLIAYHPDLSANEEKLCAFISLGLSTKDIASLTFRQVRSVESARLRLRKKLNIENADHLFDYLKQF
ncbi:hypothetical protein HNS38_11395 [Lentimicrobium sp. L6]|uniref:tetratricopeptide repeat protein n=1 Tax=Lentimicrobium sp. L6 TaxID=2735916 RepID=UPI001557284C|nr:hypothetical protein [Lentimicrobium sp. L6]NPD85370.1 hypothetical protein [Lentimicrobium sp. L6]